jgi:hypothetical protein
MAKCNFLTVSNVFSRRKNKNNSRTGKVRRNWKRFFVFVNLQGARNFREVSEIDVKINPRISLLITQQMAHKTTQAVKFIANSLKLKSGLLSPRTARCCSRFLSSEADGERISWEIAKWKKAMKI